MFIGYLNPRDSLGALLHKSFRLGSNAFAMRLESAGMDVSVEQWRLLVILSRYRGVSQSDLATLATQERTGVSRLVSGLEKKGYLRREDDRQDRRVKRLFITDEGNDMLEQTVDIAVECNAAAAEGIDPGKLQVCKDVLLQIIMNLSDGSECVLHCSEGG